MSVCHSDVQIIARYIQIGLQIFLSPLNMSNMAFYSLWNLFNIFIRVISSGTIPLISIPFKTFFWTLKGHWLFKMIDNNFNNFMLWLQACVCQCLWDCRLMAYSMHMLQKFCFQVDTWLMQMQKSKASNWIIKQHNQNCHPQVKVIPCRKCTKTYILCTVMILSFRTDMPGQTVQTQIRLLLEEQSDQGLHCLQFPLHLFDAWLLGKAILFNF